jgi:hypothetical protein
MPIYPGVAPLDVARPLQTLGPANFLMKQSLYDKACLASAKITRNVKRTARSFPHRYEDQDI